MPTYTVRVQFSDQETALVDVVNKIAQCMTQLDNWDGDHNGEYSQELAGVATGLMTQILTGGFSRAGTCVDLEEILRDMVTSRYGFDRALISALEATVPAIIS